MPSKAKKYLSGGYDDDTYIVDDPGDVVVEANLFLGGIDTVRSSVSFTLPARVENLALTGTASHGTGNGSSNVLTGNAEGNTLLGLAGNDLLEAQGGNDTLTGCEQSSGGGRGQVDTLTGGSGNDVFVLGVRVGGTLLGSSIMFYGDSNTSSPGQGDYALITDFLATRDKLQLAGAAKDYYLGASGVSGVDGQGLWARGTSAGSSDELIAIIRSANSAALTATNTLNTAIYV